MIKQFQKARIKEALESGIKSTSELAFLTGISFYAIKRILQKMEIDLVIEKRQRTRGIFWELNKESNLKK